MDNLIGNGLEVGDLDVARGNGLPDSMQEFMNQVDDLLPDGFDLYELEGDGSVYFSVEELDEIATAEIRPTTERERGYTDGGPNVFLKVTSEGDAPDETTTWFKLEEAVAYAVKRINKICGQ